jgi:DNA-binding NtrC family response regulator
MGKVRVLLIDDEEEFAHTLAERLNLRGYESGTASTVEDALGKIEKADWDVVLLDMVLKDQSGLEALRKVKAMRPALPVILLSGRGSEQDFREGERTGAFDFLIKPVRIEELIEKINQAAERQD